MWLHSLCCKIEARWSNLQANNKPAYYTLKFLPWLIAFVGLPALWELFREGWVVKVFILIICAVAIVAMLYLDFRLAKKNGFQMFWYPWIIVFALAIGFLVFGFHKPAEQIMSQPQPNPVLTLLQTQPNQYYLEIDSLDVCPVSPNTPMDVPLRIVANVNGQEYGWPIHSDWYVVKEPFEARNSPKLNVPLNTRNLSVRFPLPGGVKAYNVSFSGYINRKDKAANLIGDNFNYHPLSDRNKHKTYAMQVTDPNGGIDSVTKVIVHYRIICINEIPDIQDSDNMSNIKIDQNNQWYLKIDGIRYVRFYNAPLTMQPFRIVAMVNEQEYSFPHDAMFYFGLTDNFSSGGEESIGSESYPLQTEREQYAVRFGTINLRVRYFSTNFINVSNVDMTFGESAAFKIQDLPVKGTNRMSVMNPPQDQSVGNIQVMYEITTNR
jgi:hypothetical protein